jgi:predicted DNA-binding transcriptional regulator AlpA
MQLSKGITPNDIHFFLQLYGGHNMTTNIKKQVMNLNDVLALLGISKSTLYRLIDAGSFPKPFKLGVRLNAWRVETIETWLMAKGGI